MKYLTTVAVGVATLITFAAGPTFAQYTPGRYVSPYARPPVSPYINLLRPGSSPAVNYYGLVRPQMNMYNSLRNLQQQQSGLGTENTSEPGGPQEVFTGHRAQFMTQGRYFLNNSGPGAGGLNRGVGRGGNGAAGTTSSMAGRAGTGAGLGGVSAGYRGAALRR